MDATAGGLWVCALHRAEAGFELPDLGRADEVQEVVERQQIAKQLDRAPVVFDLRQRRANRGSCDQQSADREDHDAEPELAEMVAADRRGLASLRVVEQQR